MKQPFSVLFCLVVMTWAGMVFSQTHYKPGLRDNTPQVFAFTNARIVVSPQRTISNGTLLIRNGIIVAADANVVIPVDAWVVDLQGKTIYPGFIEMYSTAGLPGATQITEAEKGIPSGSRHWNSQVRSHFSSSAHYAYDAKVAGEMRSQGFTSAHVLPPDGIFAGTGSVVKLAGDVPSKLIISPDVSQHMSFERSAGLDRGYPTSAMGSIALIRQTLMDARWYRQAHDQWRRDARSIDRPEFNPSLDAIGLAFERRNPFVVSVEDEQWVFRASRLAREFNLPLWVVGSGHEYRRPAEIKATGLQMIIPVAFPDKPDVSRPEIALNHSLEDLRHWYMAPLNPAVLQENGINFALTTHGLSKTGDFLKNLRIAVKHGLGEEKALDALTLLPARLLGVDALTGSLDRGKTACFFIADGNIFHEGTQIEQVWVQGKKHIINETNPAAGSWKISGSELPGDTLTITPGAARLEGEIRGVASGKTIKLADVKWENGRIAFRIPKDSLQDGMVVSASINAGIMLGMAHKPDGSHFTWKAQRSASSGSESAQERSDKKTVTPSERLAPLYPAMEYGMTGRPEQPERLLIRNATIWTLGPEKVMENGDMLIERGIIRSIGRNISAPAGTVVIDAGGRHVTPGLIDPHLHTSITGAVNEVGDAITAETRIIDVIDANNVWIYRLLAGGLTTANLFHGSANPIGGTTAVVKMRHGELPDDLFMKESKPGLKFALGENVTRLPTRYPNTRMGVEQIIKDSFLAALQYEKDMNASCGTDRRGRDARPFRRNIQLEHILEVIQGNRLAHVHTYRQDEMIMMMRLAEEFNFRLASFEHTLEGYKIAHELKEHGVGAIVWTDWSSFKVEAQDGIHQNARLLLDAGVLTSLHSDQTQLATRMNWEAGKVLKSGISEEDALALVTLFPAKILKIDHRVGSLETGKDADFVIWNGHPLSSYTTPDQTWIEGRKYFDRETDKELQQKIREERAMIIKAISGQ